MTRVQLAARLESRLKSLRNEVRQAVADDSADGYGPDIDEALTRMATDDIATLTSYPQVSVLPIIARYFALNRFATLLATRVDTEGYAIEGDRSTIFDHIEKLIKAANDEALAYGYVLQVDDISQAGDANQEVDQSGNGGTWQVDALDTHWSVASEINYRYDYGEFL